MRYFIALLLPCLFISCGKPNNFERSYRDTKVKLESDFFPEYGMRYSKPDTLYLSVVLDDCGEFGGPKEEFKIYLDAAEQYRMEYKKFKFNCDSVSFYSDPRKHILEAEKSLLLAKHDKKVISLFLTQLMEAKIKEARYYNAGSIYQLRLADSSLNLHVYSQKEEVKNDFIRFKKKLGLPYTVAHYSKE